MIWGLRICFSLLCAASLSAATLNGRVELRDSKEAAVRKKKDFSGVVIWLEPLNGKPLQQPTVRARMTQKDKTFSPHMLAVPTGAVVDFRISIRSSITSSLPMTANHSTWRFILPALPKA